MLCAGGGGIALFYKVSLLAPDAVLPVPLLEVEKEFFL